MKLKLIFFPFWGIWDTSVQPAPIAISKLDFSGLFLEDTNSGGSWYLFLWIVPTYENHFFFKLEIRFIISEPVICCNIMSQWVNGFCKSLDYICLFITTQLMIIRLLTGIYFKIFYVTYFESTTAKNVIPYLLGVDGIYFLNPHLPLNPGHIPPSVTFCPVEQHNL